MHLDTSRVYQETTGDGEVWLNELGLPVRLVVHLAYPRGRATAATAKAQRRRHGHDLHLCK